MTKKKEVSTEDIMQMFAKHTSSEFDRNLKDVHNPIYLILSRRLKMKKKEVRRVVLENQPVLILRKINNDEIEQTELNSNNSNYSSDTSTISER